MNLHFRFIGTAILFFAIITSCKKSSDDAPRDPDKLRISKIIHTDISYSGKKSEIVTSFVYDDQQRVDKIVTSQVDFSDTTKYYYNGSDKKPYKSNEETSYNHRKGDTWYTYDNTGALVQDSLRSEGTYGTSITLRNYQYHTGKIKIKIATYQPSYGGIIDFTESTDSIIVHNNNITTVMRLAASPTDNGTFYHCTYDDKINPISKLNIASVKVKDRVYGFPNQMASGFCSNNIIEYISGTFTYLGHRQVQFSQHPLYTYTKEGLPETCFIDNRTDKHNYKYYYEEF